VSEINRIADKFLREYLGQNPEAELHRVVCPCKRDEIVEDSLESATEFVHKLQQLQARGLVDSRIEVSEPTTVNILRVVRKRHPIQPAFLVGFRRDGKAVWGYENRFAWAMSPDRADEVVRMLRAQGTEAFTMAAPDPNKGSL
jgi:hypothetical protein